MRNTLGENGEIVARIRDALLRGGPILIIALVGTLVLTLVHLAVVLIVEPVFLQLFTAMGGQLPLLTALTAGAPRLVRVLEILVLGPGILALLLWRLKGKPSPWLFAPEILLFVLIPVELFALYGPMWAVAAQIQ